MNLKPVYPHVEEGKQSAVCVSCKHEYDMVAMFFAPDGAPFKDYYWLTCAANAKGVTRSKAMKEVWALDPNAPMTTLPIRLDPNSPFKEMLKLEQL